MYYLGGWASLAYLALARRLRLRAHLLLVMPELCMQATACLAGLLGRQSSLEQVLPSFQGAQVCALTISSSTAYSDEFRGMTCPSGAIASSSRLCRGRRKLRCMSVMRCRPADRYG